MCRGRRRLEARLRAEWIMMKKDGSPPTTCGDDDREGVGNDEGKRVAR
jgi:hypothetical protein